MVAVQTRRPVAPDDVAALRRLAARAELADGHPSLGDSVWQDLASPASDKTTLLTAHDGDQLIGALHVAAPPSGPAVAAIVVDPEHRESGVATALMNAGAREASALGHDHLVLWAFGADARADAFALAAGFAPERELWQMRVPLPLNDDVTWPDSIGVRAFVPGEDEEQWLAVNNRAFADDPDQRNWTFTDLALRTREPWFDPAGFLLAVDGDRIVGFCWTKIHPPSPPHQPDLLGEIYVIGVDPDRRGVRLGRALVLAGLQSLHDRGITTGMLFVDATNTSATGLYEALGFTISRHDRAYGRDLP
jgi:mycothiol synthase